MPRPENISLPFIITVQENLTDFSSISVRESKFKDPFVSLYLIFP